MIAQQTKRYSGADWLEANGIETSPFGRRVADLLAIVARGIYQIDRAVRTAAWDDPRFVSINLSHKNLATCDHPSLTDLVILAHEAAIRVEIRPCGPRTLRVMFTERRRSICGARSYLEDHPTIEQAVARLRPLAELHGLLYDPFRHATGSRSPDASAEVATFGQGHAAMVARGWNGTGVDSSEFGRVETHRPVRPR
jgi:hypothetical protein